MRTDPSSLVLPQRTPERFRARLLHRTAREDILDRIPEVALGAVRQVGSIRVERAGVKDVALRIEEDSVRRVVDAERVSEDRAAVLEDRHGQRASACVFALRW